MSQQQPQVPSQPATPLRAESADPSIRYVGLDVHKQQITYCILDGPPGHFFQRIKKRKNHNVAVVATARKLAMIAWRMLTTNEPYRYSEPRTTTDKLAHLRVIATGGKRTGGNPKGSKSTARLPGGSRSIRSLDEVLANEGLPKQSPIPPGEQRHLHATGIDAFVEKINNPQVIPGKSTATAQTRKNTGRQRRIANAE